MHDPRLLAPGIRQCPVLRHKTQPGISGLELWEQKSAPGAAHRCPGCCRGNAATASRSLPGAPATAPGTLRRKPSPIFVGKGPNGAAVVTGCKRSDFIPRHAECLSLPNKFFHTALRDDLSSQARKCFPTLPLDREKADPPLHTLPPSPCNLKVAVPRNQDMHMGIIPCIISSSGLSSFKI